MHRCACADWCFVTCDRVEEWNYSSYTSSTPSPAVSLPRDTSCDGHMTPSLTTHTHTQQSYQNPATPGGASYDNPATPSPVVPESPQSSGTGSYYGGSSSGGGGTSGFGMGSTDYMTPSPGVSPLTPSYTPQTPGSPMMGRCIERLNFRCKIFVAPWPEVGGWVGSKVGVKVPFLLCSCSDG